MIFFCSMCELILLLLFFFFFQNAIKETYNIPSSQLRIFIHYQPSFFHLHVHFTYLNFEAPGIVSSTQIVRGVFARSTCYPGFLVTEKAPLKVKPLEGGNSCPLEVM